MDIKTMLPKELRTRAKKAVLKRIIAFVLLFLGFGAILFFWGEIIFKSDSVLFKAICYTIVMLLPFLITKMPFKLIDRTWSGEVVNIGVKQENCVTTVGGKPLAYIKNHLVLKVKHPNGKIKKRIAMTLEVKRTNGNDRNFALGKIENQMDRYKIGDMVYHFYGYKYPHVVSKTPDAKKHCISCGCTNGMDKATCWNCNLPLIAISEI